MSSGRRPRILQLGCGRWGRNILRDLVALGAEVVVADPSPEACAVAATLGAAQTHDACPSRCAVDGVVIATPASTHHDALAPFLAGTIPVFIEKPLCTSAAHARAIQAAARCPLHVMDKWRYHPSIVRLAGIARSGTLGRIVALRTTRVQPEHRHADADAIWTLAPHDLGIAREIIGRIPPLRHARRDGAGPAGGVLAVFGGGDAAPELILEVSAMRERRVREVSLIGTAGEAWMDDPEAHAIHVARHGAGAGAAEREATPGEAPLLAELRAFLGFLAGGPPPKGSLAEAVATVEILEALHAGGPVRSSEPW